MSGKLNKLAIFGIMAILIFNTVNDFYSVESNAEEDEIFPITDSREVIGPMNLINNSNFSYTGDWVTINASRFGLPIIILKYDNTTTPSYMNFISGHPIDHSPLTYTAYLNQTFYKPIWTPDLASALVCSLQYNMTNYDSSVGSGPPPPPRIDGEIFLEIKNMTSGFSRVWGLASGAFSFTANTDPRIGVTQNVKLNIGSDKVKFKITPPGYYNISIYFKISSTMTSNIVDFLADLRIDNVSFMIEDKYEPIIYANNTIFGPYNSSQYANIDIDFHYGGLENTTLKKAMYRLNNTGNPGPWHYIFRNNMSFTQDWSISPIWDDLNQGNSTIDIICIDELGNYNDSVKIMIIKDTIAPVTNALPLNKYQTSKEFNINYQAFDPQPTGGYNNTVKLMFRHNGKGPYQEYTPSWNPFGLFNQSPIKFNINDAGIRKEGKYEFYTIGIDLAGNRELPPVSQSSPDSESSEDYTKPSPQIIFPNNMFIRDKVTISVISDNDTEYVEFYYWVDVDEDGIPDDDDIDSTWKRIGNITSPSDENNWSIVWNTTNFSKYPEFKNNEFKVILKAIAKDTAGNIGEDIKRDFEVDNIAPIMVITNPKHNTVENGLNMYINYTTHDDVKSINVYYRIADKEVSWTTIDTDIMHNYGTTTGSYVWKIPSSLRIQKPKIDIKVEVIDDTGNDGSEIVSVGINWDLEDDYPLSNFPFQFTLEEDFGRYTLNLRDYKNPKYSDSKWENLRWYITGNSEKLFHITGNNATGDHVGEFIFTSKPDVYGIEKLVYHLRDPKGLEDTFPQTVIVIPLPCCTIEFYPPTEEIHVTVGEADEFDLSNYLSYSDSNLNNLTLSLEDPTHITTDGLKLIFNYPKEMVGQRRIVEVTVSDIDEWRRGTLKLFLTDNHRPKLIKPFPTDLELWYDEVEKDILNLSEHFMDPDGDELIFNGTADNIKISITGSLVTIEPISKSDKLETIRFRATDVYGAFVEGDMLIQLRYENEPPRIRDIPDLNIHYYSLENIEDYYGYSYDFSYFIIDPDNDRSELSIRALAIEGGRTQYIENDPNNNMRLIFKFPFEIADGKSHPFYLYVRDPDPKSEVNKLFNITIIIDNWPVEYSKSIPDQYFQADLGLEDAFNIKDYFIDRDYGTTYEVIPDPNRIIEGKIDNDYNVDLSCKYKYWKGTKELVIIAHDTYPEQFVYAIFYVHVSLPEIPTLPDINLKLKFEEEYTLDLSNKLENLDFDVSKLIIETDHPSYIQVEGSKLTIKFNKSGNHIIKYRAKHKDDLFITYGKLIIDVEPRPKREAHYSSNMLMAGLGIIIVIMLIIILFLIIRKYKHRIKKDKK